MSPYRKVERLIPAENLDTAVVHIVAQENATLVASPSFEEICMRFEDYVKNPKSLKEMVSARLSKNRHELLQSLIASAPHCVISIQELIRISLQETLQGIVKSKKMKKINLRLFDRIMAGLGDFSARKLDCLDLSTVEGKAEALDIVQAIIEALNDRKHLLSKVLREGYVETDEVYLTQGALKLGQLVPVDREHLPECRLSPEQRENLEYIMLALGSRMQLAAGAIDESSKEIEGNQVEKVQEFLYLFGDEKRSEMGNQLEGFSIDRSGTPKEILRITSAGFLLVDILFPAFVKSAPGDYEKVQIPHVISIIVLALVSLYLFLFRRKNRLRALRDSHPLEQIQQEMENELAIYKILTQLEESKELLRYRKLDSLKLRQVVARIKVLDAMLTAAITENDPTKREATIQVGDSTIHLGPAAFQQTLDGWSINIGTAQKPEWVFGNRDPQYQPKQKLLPQVPIEDLSAQKQALEAAQQSEAVAEEEAGVQTQSPGCARA